ncbi:MAG TPA: serine/threonine-protein kinase, partial [Myxococcaceae bacterium]|nr:serine/threonine-protein kinase [Myxococcaceae bacterium]
EDWAKRDLTILLHLQHPHVVKLVGHVKGPAQTPGYLVLVMEYVRGRTLYYWAKEENPSAREVARVVRKLCRALAAVHSAGVLHRDFKGENVLVRDEDGEPVLVDFGVSAVPWAPRVTRDGMAPCTPFYRSPECVRFIVDPKRPLDAPYPYAKADDLFALGVTLYVLLTGVYPFWGRDEFDLMRVIAQEAPRAAHEHNRRVPQVLGELCMRLLETQPEARSASAEAGGEALEAMLAQADERWDEPLCYGWDAAGRTTQRVPALQDSKEPARKNRHPRRGPNPASAEAPPVEAPPAAAAPAMEVAPPGERSAAPSVVDSPGRPGHAVARGKLLRVGGVCGLLLAGLGSSHVLLGQEPRPDTEPPMAPTPAGPVLAALLRGTFPGGERTSEACRVREVAPLWKPPEAGAGAAPPRADTPAPVVSVTTLRKGETLVKKKREPKAPVVREVRNGNASELALLCVGAATAAACTGAQVRPVPEPAPEACPAGAVEVMTERFDIPIGGESPGIFLPGFDPFQGGKREPIPVQEGPIRVEFLGPWGKLPEGSFLSGRLIIGPERVYGRFTEAWLPGGERLPVCFALVPTAGGEQGLPIRGTDEQGAVKVFPIARVRPVENFK